MHIINNLKTANLIILVLFILLIIALFKILQLLGGLRKRGIKINFLKPVPNPDAKHNMKLYRGWTIFLKDTKAVFYSKEAIQNYINAFDSFSKDKMRGVTGLDWAIGFYPMYKEDNDGKTRLDFLIVPTPANINYAGTTKETINVPEEYDFYEALKLTDLSDIQKSPYRMKTNDNQIAENIGYDTGHIYP